jgi:glycerol kinase
VTETTALGVAYLAGICSTIFKNAEDVAARWRLDRRFDPVMKKAERDRLYAGWQAAIARVL